jgi:hypothetical protein
MGPIYCRVKHAGAHRQGRVYIRVKEIDGKFELWFLAPPGVQKEMLATALAALSTNRVCSIDLPEIKENAEFNEFYMTDAQ